jgi:acyl-CoA synthetase (AMP-forming)/AMP-acid ligase II
MNIGHMLTDSAERHPDRPAFIYGDEVTTYRHANARANALAAGLRHLGMKRGDRVAVWMWNRPELLEGFFGVWKAGGCVVPLNARFLAEEAVYHLSDPRASVLFFDEEFRAVVDEIRGRLPHVKHFICAGEPLPGQVSYGELLSSFVGSSEPDAEVADDDLAWLFYTSGTTGRPKGAMLTHGNLTFAAVGWVADMMHLEPEDVGLHAAPLTHGAGFHAVALTMKASCQVILKGHHFDAALFCAAVEQHRVTNTWLVPTQIKLLLRDESLGRWDLSSLKCVLYGGAPMYEADLRKALRRFGHIFVQLFGQGESPMTITCLRREEHVENGPPARRLLSCGHARSGIEVRILGEDHGELPRGVVGEICVRGPSVMKGYWERPEATAQTLRDGWLHTGDLGSMDRHGYVYIQDRSKDLIISGGENVYPREVEEVLMQHPSISEVCVIGVPDDLWGESVKALVVLKPCASATAEEIIAFAAERIAGYKKPKSVDFLPELPKNAYGKVLKRELRDRYWKGRELKV